MRQAIFRTLAGLLGIVFAWAIYLKPLGWRDLPAFFCQVGIAVMFAAYALFGDRMAPAAAPVQLEGPERADMHEIDDDQAHLHQPPDEGQMQEAAGRGAAPFPREAAARLRLMGRVDHGGRARR